MDVWTLSQPTQQKNESLIFLTLKDFFYYLVDIIVHAIYYWFSQKININYIGWPISG